MSSPQCLINYKSNIFWGVGPMLSWVVCDVKAVLGDCGVIAVLGGV